jgi:hypothetical protein
VLDTSTEVSLSLLRGHTVVVWVSRGDLDGDVGSEDDGIVTDRFNKEELESWLSFDAVDESLSTCSGTVGRV